MSTRTLGLILDTGISGDMIAAALYDLASADLRAHMLSVLENLNLEGFKIKVSTVIRDSLKCCDFDVILDEDNHDHDMEYLYGHEHQQENHAGAVKPVLKFNFTKDFSDKTSTAAHYAKFENLSLKDGGLLGLNISSHDEHHHSAAHEHLHEHGSGHHDHHHHRNLANVAKIIQNSAASESAKKIALKVFDIIAEAEAKAHGTTPSQVHFHEVGALDSICDILAFAVLFDGLKIDRVFIPYITEGQGTVRCQHGILPVPVPAVKNILDKTDIELRILERRGELVTPTGAAIAAFLRNEVMQYEGSGERFNISKIGFGAGKRRYEVPSIVKAVLEEKDEKLLDSGAALGEKTIPLAPHFEDSCRICPVLNAKRISVYAEPLAEPGDSEILKIEANIDDSTPEALGFLMEQLFSQGALEVFFTPIFMKKMRPGSLVTVILEQKSFDKVRACLFAGSTTIGMRYAKMQRCILPRSRIIVQADEREFIFKEVRLDENKRWYPEFESLKKLAASEGKSFIDLLNEAIMLSGLLINIAK